MSRPPVFWFTRSTNAGGKLCSWPNRIPIFFIQQEPRITRIYTDSSNAKVLKPFRMPIRILQAALALVLEKFVNRRQQYTRSFWIDSDLEVEFIVQEMNIAAPEHGEKSSRDLEIVGVNYPF